MRLYEIKYENSEGEVRREFASSDGEASKRSTALKASNVAMKKPSREAVEIPTDKAGLIGWLNQNATRAEQQ